MKKLNMVGFKRGLRSAWNKNGQMVLAVTAAGTAIGAVVSAIKAGPKATAIKEERAEKLNELTEKLQEKEINQEEFKKEQRAINWQAAKEYACTYGTTAALLAISVGATACGYKVSIGKQAVLLGAYKALETRNGELTEKVKEVLGEKKFNALENDIIKDHIKNSDIDPEMLKDPDPDAKAPYAYTFWDAYNGRPFRATRSQVEQGMLKASRYLYGRDTITVNQIHEFIGGDQVGLVPSDSGESHGFISNDLDSDCLIPYSIEPIQVDGYENAMLALKLGKFGRRPALLGFDD